MDLDQVLSECQLSHRRLRQTLARLDDDTARRPSRLPGWSIGHLVTHLARNADSQVRVLQGARQGDRLEQYEGGPTQRRGDIEAGALRPAGELLDDLIVAFATLEQEWDAMTPDAWSGYGYQNGVEWPCRQLPFFRWREVEVHHVDLGLGYETTDWPPSYVESELRLALDGLPARLDSPPTPALLLGWLIGRGECPDLTLGDWVPRPADPRLVPGG